MGSRGPAGKDAPKRRRQKERAAGAVAAGETFEEAARIAGIDPSTLRRWRTADEAEFARLVSEQKRTLALGWDTAIPLIVQELLARLRDPEQVRKIPLRDLAGLLHLASQHQERCTPAAPPQTPQADQPHTPAAFAALLDKMGLARKES